MKYLVLSILLSSAAYAEVSEPTGVPTVEALCAVLKSGLAATGIAATCKPVESVLIVTIHDVTDGDYRTATLIAAGSASLVSRMAMLGTQVKYVAVKVAGTAFLWRGADPGRCFDTYGRISDEMLYNCIEKAMIR